MRTILVTGGQGQVGLELARQDWPADMSIHYPARAELDIASQASLAAYLRGRSFDAIINCAAYTAVDRAEEEPDLAFLVNGEAPGWLADTGIPLVHVSTDYVFDGSGDGYYREEDPVAPLGVYGASKREGERAVGAGQSRSVILRTAWVLSAHRSNFLKTMLRVGATNPVLRVVDDQRGCPTSAADIASALRAIALRLIDDPAAPLGTYHFVNAGEASWCELAREIFALSAAAGGPSAAVEAIATADYPTPARRPANSRLSTAKIAADYGIYPRDWRAAVRDIVDELVGRGRSE
ncbi:MULTISPECIES: dTDP-4-dehydrorhamnose reductase [unclassified Sphingomonas]|uniref:dTDP-4-dehydrorhamnose reductase n=1 Tax=unclassified Sphingomonas TaxID=196159 RepID=UPI0006F33C4D|nr:MULTISPECIES: dTDP-4-dehydrorhamnose reductase [unclassified Sphingomonas]KQX22733.1 NAD(P)-dependent oxidoreductase [Sphingomonas sp. Root1294]KQY67787.1 NAD(P)-dependent oxidoreductase [Sphingomonas sp. Root50]KRB88710.1 NAD(P)-dependent oxidoreductase [Sphingomonas sp. Root720]